MNTLSIDIRSALPHDAPAIADIHQQAWYGAYSGIIPHKIPQRHDQPARQQNGGNTPFSAPLRSSSSSLAASLPDMPRSAAIARGNCRRRGKSTNSTCDRKYSGRRPRQPSVRRCPRSTGGAQSAWSGGLGRLPTTTARFPSMTDLAAHEIAEGAETFDGKSLQKIAFVWD